MLLISSESAAPFNPKRGTSMMFIQSFIPAPASIINVTSEGLPKACITVSNGKVTAHPMTDIPSIINGSCAAVHSAPLPENSRPSISPDITVIPSPHGIAADAVSVSSLRIFRIKAELSFSTTAADSDGITLFPSMAVTVGTSP